jgi:DNA-binding MarR family transcriptional regulator
MPARTRLEPDVAELAGRLRFSVFRLGRLLRQQDDSGYAPALIAALATIVREGPITLGALAANEQLTPPSITKVVVTLEEAGFVTRQRDESDKRVCRVVATAKGRRQLEVSRTRRTAWLVSQLQELPPADIERLVDAVDVLERLTGARP